eukprot:426519-Amphidinium_carterae.1
MDRWGLTVDAFYHRSFSARSTSATIATHSHFTLVVNPTRKQLSSRTMLPNGTLSSTDSVPIGTVITE